MRCISATLFFVIAALPAADLTDILYHRHRETIASPPPDPEVVGLG